MIVYGFTIENQEQAKKIMDGTQDKLISILKENNDFIGVHVGLFHTDIVFKTEQGMQYGYATAVMLQYKTAMVRKGTGEVDEKFLSK